MNNVNAAQWHLRWVPKLSNNIHLNTSSRLLICHLYMTLAADNSFNTLCQFCQIVERSSELLKLKKKKQCKFSILLQHLSPSTFQVVTGTLTQWTDCYTHCTIGLTLLYFAPCQRGGGEDERGHGTSGHLRVVV
jgi:hypothetical protein